MNALINGYLPHGTIVIIGTYSMNTRINGYIPYEYTY